MSLITTAQAGIASATQPRKVLARIWILIGLALDGHIQQLGDSRCLVWVPAHTSPSSIGEVKRSDGARLTHVDWRANRLADGLAKLAARHSRLPPAVLKLLASALEAVKYSAKLLGRVTFASNNHLVHELGEDGSYTTRTLRDSVDRPKVRKEAPASALQSLPLPPPPADARQVRAWEPPRAARLRRPSAATALLRRTRAQDEEHLQRRVHELGELQQPSAAGDAAGRLEALRARVLQRCSGHA